MSFEPTNKRHRIRDFVLYFAITLTFAGAVIAAALSDVKQDTIMKWNFFFFYSLIALWAFINGSRAVWSRPLFWMFFSSVLVLHCGILWVILTRVQHLEGAWIAAGVLEAAFLLAIEKWLIPPTPKQR